jgi:hypothetical protein
MGIERIVLVYDADGGIAGEISYVVGKLRGTSHCSLCDITHGVTGEKSAWRSCRAALGVPVDALHRNELDRAQRRAVDGKLPCVLARTEDGYERIVERDALEGCEGDVDRLRARIEEAIERHAGSRPAR